MESSSLSLEGLKEEQDIFNKNVRYGGRHPVTKRVILQKVAKYFDDSIKNKVRLFLDDLYIWSYSHFLSEGWWNIFDKSL